MENNEENNFKKITGSYSKNSDIFSSDKPKNNFSIFKNIAIPFISGVIGTTSVLACYNYIPKLNDIPISNIETSIDIPNNFNNELISIQEYSNTSIYVANKVKPSIVGISVEYPLNSMFGTSTSTTEAAGSGVIISEDGYILTNNHVISSSTSASSFYEIGEATNITVTLYGDETLYSAEIIGKDAQTDLAVIKIDKDNLIAAELGNSDEVQVGEFCMAVGNSLGLGDTVTSGIVSAVNRLVVDADNNQYEAIQTDAAINSGNSGGALVNSKGEVIGINTLKIAATGVEGVGFAIPINSTTSIYEDLITYNKVKRPYIGIAGIDVTEDLAKQNNLVIGVYVKTIDDFSAAEKGGLKVGDVIIGIDDNKIENMDELNAYKNTKEIGDSLILTVNRNNEEIELEIILGEQP